jgi:phosphatidylglycerophosphate synthase
MRVMLAWIPFVQPAPGASSWWWALVVPFSLFISMAWRSVRQKDLSRYWPAVARMSAQIVVGMIGLFVFLALIVRVVVPIIPAE